MGVNPCKTARCNRLLLDGYAFRCRSFPILPSVSAEGLRLLPCSSLARVLSLSPTIFAACSRVSPKASRPCLSLSPIDPPRGLGS